WSFPMADQPGLRGKLLRGWRELSIRIYGNDNSRSRRKLYTEWRRYPIFQLGDETELLALEDRLLSFLEARSAAAEEWLRPKFSAVARVLLRTMPLNDVMGAVGRLPSGSITVRSRPTCKTSKALPCGGRCDSKSQFPSQNSRQPGGSDRPAGGLHRWQRQAHAQDVRSRRRSGRLCSCRVGAAPTLQHTF